MVDGVQRIIGQAISSKMGDICGVAVSGGYVPRSEAVLPSTRFTRSAICLPTTYSKSTSICIHGSRMLNARCPITTNITFIAGIGAGGVDGDTVLFLA